MTATGLEGVVAFETEIAEPDRDGNALRYRGVDIEELVGRVPFERVWSLLVGGGTTRGPRRCGPGSWAAARCPMSSRRRTRAAATRGATCRRHWRGSSRPR